MTGAKRPVTRDQRQAGEREVADGVEHFVANKLVRVAQAFRIEHPLAVERHGVVERGAQREANLRQALDVAQEAEGAGAR